MKPTTNVSAMSTNISRNCSINSGTLRFLSSLFENMKGDLDSSFFESRRAGAGERAFVICPAA